MSEIFGQLIIVVLAVAVVGGLIYSGREVFQGRGKDPDESVVGFVDSQGNWNMSNYYIFFYCLFLAILGCLVLFSYFIE
jgi:hypothetical protein|tara:strand:+ start:92 stop:328 length:237 start_codon:yes stop_codon:yes gene_type:complete